MLKAKSSVVDVAVRYTLEEALENLSVAAALEKCGFVREVIVAVVEAVAAEDDVPEPCNVVPIPGLHLASCLRPFQRIPWESCMEEFPHSETYVACPARSFSAPTAMLLVSSSLPLASSCPPRLSHGASSSSILPHLAIAVGEQATVPWVDLKVVGLLEEVAV